MADLQSAARSPHGVSQPITCGKRDTRLVRVLHSFPESGRETGQSATSEIPKSADLAVVVDAWPRLPEHVRLTIVGLVYGSVLNVQSAMVN